MTHVLKVFTTLLRLSFAGFMAVAALGCLALGVWELMFAAEVGSFGAGALVSLLCWGLGLTIAYHLRYWRTIEKVLKAHAIGAAMIICVVGMFACFTASEIFMPSKILESPYAVAGLAFAVGLCFTLVASMFKSDKNSAARRKASSEWIEKANR